MNRRLQWAQHLLRRWGLLPLVERVRYVVSLLRRRQSNSRFVRQNPAFALPPAWLAFDAYSVPDWEYYKRSGEATALAVAELLSRELGGGQLQRVLEWGCGPGRVIRHLRSALGEPVEVIGTDYNSDSIAWCRAHVPDVLFEVNALEPPLQFVESCSIDAAIALSVFTHLSEERSLAWMQEMTRLLRPGGLFMFTTNGVGFVGMLLPSEKRLLDEVGIAVRANYDEGKKMYTRLNRCADAADRIPFRVGRAIRGPSSLRLAASPATPQRWPELALDRRSTPRRSTCVANSGLWTPVTAAACLLQARDGRAPDGLRRRMARSRAVRAVARRSSQPRAVQRV